MSTKPHLVIVEARPVEVERPRPSERERRLEEARKRFGRKWAHEPGSDFQWNAGPTVLELWKAEQITKRREG